MKITLLTGCGCTKAIEVERSEGREPDEMCIPLVTAPPIPAGTSIDWVSAVSAARPVPACYRRFIRSVTDDRRGEPPVYREYIDVSALDALRKAIP